jgi:hypothetical protein
MGLPGAWDRGVVKAHLAPLFGTFAILPNQRTREEVDDCDRAASIDGNAPACRSISALCALALCLRQQPWPGVHLTRLGIAAHWSVQVGLPSLPSHPMSLTLSVSFQPLLTPQTLDTPSAVFVICGTGKVKILWCVRWTAGHRTTVPCSQPNSLESASIGPKRTRTVCFVK